MQWHIATSTAAREPSTLQVPRCAAALSTPRQVRAKEESIGALLRLARSAHVGPAELAVYVLQPLAKGKEKSVHAALGR